MMFNASNLRACKRRYTEEEARVTGRIRAMMLKADPEFPNTVDCFKPEDREVKQLRNRLNKVLERGGIKCKGVFRDDSFDLWNCHLTDKYMEKYGKNYDLLEGEETNSLNVYDVAEASQIINEMLDEKRMWAGVMFEGNLGKDFKILIRKEDEHDVEYQFNEIEHQLVKTFEDDDSNKPEGVKFVLVSDINKSKGDGRDKYWEKNRDIKNRGKSVVETATVRKDTPTPYPDMKTQFIAMRKRSRGTSKAGGEEGVRKLSERLKKRGERN